MPIGRVDRAVGGALHHRHEDARRGRRRGDRRPRVHGGDGDLVPLRHFVGRRSGLRLAVTITRPSTASRPIRKGSCPLPLSTPGSPKSHKLPLVRVEKQAFSTSSDDQRRSVFPRGRSRLDQLLLALEAAVLVLDRSSGRSRPRTAPRGNAASRPRPDRADAAPATPSRPRGCRAGRSRRGAPRGPSPDVEDPVGEVVDGPF